MEGTLQIIQHYRQTQAIFMVSVWQWNIFRKCFQDCSCNLQDDLSAKGVSRKVGVLSAA